MIRLSQVISVKRRYVRAVNLERDLDAPGSLEGYTITPRTISTLKRFAAAHQDTHASHAWTITGVYGSGKSAFAHFLACLCGPKDGSLRQAATALLRRDEETRPLSVWFQSRVPAEGFMRAIVSASRESVSDAVLRGVATGAEVFWARRRGPRPEALKQVRLMQSLASKGSHINERDVVDMVGELARASGSGMLLIIDELGKLLEDAGRSGGSRDLLLLQQLAEMSSVAAAPIRIVGLLHQAFSEYGSALGTIERNEWDKVQGRFEDVPFTGPTEEMLYLVGRAIERKVPAAVDAQIANFAVKWERHLESSLPHPYAAKVLDSKLIDAVYPLHPIAALILPSLCAKYAQHDRSLFTFLTSSEPHSLGSFIVDAQLSAEQMPLFPLHQVYEYFANALGGASHRPQCQRWVEIHGVVSDARNLAPDEVAALKTIGVLNLLASSGPLRASRGLVTAALVQSPEETHERWHKVLNGLVAQRILTYRTQVDEFRIWEGSDFDVETATKTHLAAERRSLAAALSEVASLSPLVAQRHSYRTGTLRYFERRFVDHEESLSSTRATKAADGVVVYWVAEAPPKVVQPKTSDGKPLVIAMLHEPAALRSAVLELAALRAVERNALALQTDGVARREVRARMRLAQGVLDSALRVALDPENFQRLWVNGEKVSPRRFHVTLSDVCDRTYSKSPTLWNELINRRELTSQGARAQRELIEALVLRPEMERFGLQGEGPALSMYASLFRQTGIHRGTGEHWILEPPGPKSGVRDLWRAIESFCLDAIDRPRTLDGLYELLEAPPYGVKRGMIPIFVAAVLAVHEEDIAVYREGTFIPVLGPEHFEVLVRQPGLFAVKHIAVSDLRQEFFRDLERMIQSANTRQAAKTRNASLLAAVRPLLRFATALPKVTRQTEQISKKARDVRAALLTAAEPDRLLFETLPEACGQPPLSTQKAKRAPDYHGFLQQLKAALRELSMHYEEVLDRCRLQIHTAFGIQSELGGLREDLRVRSSYLLGQCLEPRLRSFIFAASRSDADEKEWLESLVMIVADRGLEAWSDADLLSFEANLAEMARRFANLEALQKEAARSQAPGYEARRITITRSDGVELSDLVWVDADQSASLEPQVVRILEQISSLNPEHQRHALAVSVLERLLGERHTPKLIDKESEEAVKVGRG